MDKWLHVEINSIMADYNRKTYLTYRKTAYLFLLSVSLDLALSILLATVFESRGCITLSGFISM